MPQPPFKAEEYLLLGGENSKASEWATNQHEFLSLRNWDFSKPGSLTKRPGTATFNGLVGVSQAVTGLFEYERLDGFSQIIASGPNGLYQQAGGGLTQISAGYSAITSFTPFVDKLFVFDGLTMGGKWNGTTFYQYSLPAGHYDSTVSNTSPPVVLANCVTPPCNIHMITTGGLSGVYRFGVQWLNERGFLGPVKASYITLNGITFKGVSMRTMALDSGNPWGVTAAVFSRSIVDGSDLFVTSRRAVTAGTFTVYADTGATLGAGPITEYLDLYFESSSSVLPRFKPKYSEIYNNQMFLAGSDILKSVTTQIEDVDFDSSVVFSEIGEPEGVLTENIIEVRTDDGDKVRGMKAYGRALYIFKERSFHELSGDDPTNFVLKEVSDQYGCLNHRAIVPFKDFLTWLDVKGVCIFNGAAVDILSDKIEPILKRMNLEQARISACGIHVKARNEIWYSLPIDGSTFNNIIIVYDYLAKAWTSFTGVFPNSLQIMRSSFEKDTPFFGDYDGNIKYFGATLYSDSGSTISCSAKSRYLADLGKSVTKQFRRVYADVNKGVGVTNLLGVNLRADYSDTVSETRVIDMGSTFQTRVEFGIPAKSMSVEFTHNSASSPCVLNGYTIEYRMQRMT